MTSNKTVVELRDIRKTFKNFVALDDVSLSIRQGEFFSVLGPSGCGKSTMLRLIAGFEWAERGTLMIDGASMDGVPAYHRPCNMVFQNYAIFPHLNVSDNVAYGLRSLGLSRDELQRRVSDKLAAVRLAGMESRKPDQLSGGQRQRVALARALVREPSVLLLDEPLGALDKTLREQMQHELRELQSSVGITFVLVTHDQEEALSMSDRVAVMSNGRILQVAPPRQVYEQPGCSTVASFIGDMNFIAAETEVVYGGRAVVSVGGIGQLEFAEPVASDCAGFRHHVAIRPEKLRLSTGPTEADICICGTVVSASYWGDQSQIQVAVEGCNSRLVAAAFNPGEMGGSLPEQGERVWLSASRGAFMRFGD